MPMHFASWSLWRPGIAAGVVALIMPESSRLRALVPAPALQHLKAVFAGSSTLGSLVVVDWWDALSDDSFVDLIHANPAGRRINDGAVFNICSR